MTVTRKSSFDQLIRAMSALERREVRVGWRDPEAAEVAYINDRGGDRGNNPPPRPVLGPGLAAVADDLRRGQARVAVMVLRRQDPTAALEELGATAEEAVRQAIREVQPENAPSTIARKGFDGPLRGAVGDRIWTHLEHWVEDPLAGLGSAAGGKG